MIRTLWRPAPLALAIGVCACVPPQTPEPRQLHSPPTSCADAPSPDTTVYSPSQLNEKPIVRTVPKLVYPREARERHVEGRVVVTAVVNATGEIDKPSLAISQSADAQLDAEARRFVSAATLWPGCRNGHAVRVRIGVPVEFVYSSRPAVGYWTAFGIGVLGGVVAALAVALTR